MGLSTIFFVVALVWGAICSRERSLERLLRRQLSLKFKISPHESSPYLTTLARLMNLRPESTSIKDSMVPVNGLINLQRSMEYYVSFNTTLHETFKAASARLGLQYFTVSASVDNEEEIMKDPSITPDNDPITVTWLEGDIMQMQGSKSVDYYSVWLKADSPRFQLVMSHYFLLADEREVKRMDLLAFIEPKKRENPNGEYLLYLCIDHRWYCIDDELLDAGTETPSIKTKITFIDILKNPHPLAIFYRSSKVDF